MATGLHHVANFFQANFELPPYDVEKWQQAVESNSN
jgi:hypothetical protein